jgi:hypothetical protein
MLQYIACSFGDQVDWRTELQKRKERADNFRSIAPKNLSAYDKAFQRWQNKEVGQRRFVVDQERVQQQTRVELKEILLQLGRIVALCRLQNVAREILDLLVKLREESDKDDDALSEHMRERSKRRAGVGAIRYARDVVGFVRACFVIQGNEHFCETVSIAKLVSLPTKHLTYRTSSSDLCIQRNDECKKTLVYVWLVDRLELDCRFQTRRVDAELQTGSGQLFTAANQWC